MLLPPWFYIAGIVVVVFVLIGCVTLMLRDTGTKTTASRLDIIIGGKRREESSKADILKASALESDRKTFLEMITPNIPSLQRVFEQADCNIKPSALFGVALALGLAGTAVSTLTLVKVAGSLVAATGFGLLFGLIMASIPFIWLLNKRRVRMNKFAQQLPDALELVARALRAGHALAAGMHVVAEEMPPPIADEFNHVVQEQNLGISIEEAMKSMCERMPNLDLRFFVTSVAIQRQTGGDLAEILDKIGYVIRERYRILGQVKALTGEGRLSGVVLIALPFVMFLVMLHLSFEYESTLWKDPRGRLMALFAIVLQILGAYCIKKIVDIKV
jgi:tight adherence protein B